eukprot:10005881-Prorocentrum_lima.AAC.1
MTSSLVGSEMCIRDSLRVAGISKGQGHRLAQLEEEVAEGSILFKDVKDLGEKCDLGNQQG